MLHRRKHVPESVLDATAKMGVHPHHLTHEAVMKALNDGTLTQDECDGLLSWLDDGSPVTEDKAN